MEALIAVICIVFATGFLVLTVWLVLYLSKLRMKRFVKLLQTRFPDAALDDGLFAQGIHFTMKGLPARIGWYAGGGSGRHHRPPKTIIRVNLPENAASALEMMQFSMTLKNNRKPPRDQLRQFLEISVENSHLREIVEDDSRMREALETIFLLEKNFVGLAASMSLKKTEFVVSVADYVSGNEQLLLLADNARILFERALNAAESAGAALPESLSQLDGDETAENIHAQASIESPQ